MILFMRTLFCTVFCLSVVSYTSADAQTANIFMRDGMVIKNAVLESQTPGHVYSSKGIYEIKEIFGIQFEDSDSTAARAYVSNLSPKNVTILIGQVRINPPGGYQPSPPRTPFNETMPVAVNIFMRDGRAFRNVKLMSESLPYLYSSAGKHTVNEIYSINFESYDNTVAKMYLKDLSPAGVTFFIGETRIDPPTGRQDPPDNLRVNRTTPSHVTIIRSNGDFIRNQLIKFQSPTELYTTRDSYKLEDISALQFNEADSTLAKAYLKTLSPKGITFFIGETRIDAPTNNLRGSQIQETENSIKSPNTDPKKARTDSPFAANPGIVNHPEGPYATLGVGAGLDYGGVGFRFAFCPEKSLDLFLAGGYNFTGVGVNGGMMVNVLPNNRVTPTLSLMYGYNAALKVTSGSSDLINKTYYGPSLGVGCKIYGKGKGKSIFNLGIIIPFRSSEYDQDLSAIKSNPQIKLDSEPWRVLLSIGCNFRLK